MNSFLKATAVFFFLLLFATSIAYPHNLTHADSLKISEEWWLKGFDEYEHGNYQAAYDLFAKSFEYCNEQMVWYERSPYRAMNHCLYKMDKTEQIDKINVPRYYEELDTVVLFSADIQAAQSSLYRQGVDSAMFYFNRALRGDTLINRQNREVHADRLELMADNFFNLGYHQHAKECLRKELKIKEKLLPIDEQYELEQIKWKLVDTYVCLGQLDSALAVAHEVASKYKTGNNKFFVLGYEQAETCLINTYLKAGRFNDAYKELEYADSVYKVLEGQHYDPSFRMAREVDYYNAIGRYDKAYKLAITLDSIQHADTTIFHYQDPRALAFLCSQVGNHTKSIQILDSLVTSNNRERSDSLVFISPIEVNDVSMLANAYYSDGQIKIALDKYLILDSIYNSFYRKQNSTRGFDNNYIVTLHRITELSYALGLDSLGDAYYEKISNEINRFKFIEEAWRKDIYFLDAYRAMRHGNVEDAIAYGEKYIQEYNGNVYAWIKDRISYWYLITGQFDKAYTMMSEVIKYRKKAILDNFEELSESERKQLWRPNANSFRNLLWSILCKQDSALWGQAYNDIALFSKGLMLTTATNKDYKRALGVSWKDIQSKLKKREMAIEFLTIPEFIMNQDSTIYAALYLKKKMEYPCIKFLCRSGDLRDAVNSSNKMIDDKDLYDMIWGQLEEEMSGILTVYFSADGYLHKIPIEYLNQSHRKKKFDAYRLTSTREIVLRQKAKHFNNVALYGGLDYHGKYNSLRHSREEIDSIAFFLSKTKASIKKYYNQEGTIHSFMAYNQQPISIMHLVTHGVYLKNDNDAMPPNIQPIITEDEEDAAMSHSWLAMCDGDLTAKDIAKMRIKDLNLVTLSACNSALGDISDGEGVFGLQRAFKKAGALSILMTLWDVNDKATAEFMGYFYKRVCKGDSYQKALKKAQLHMKRYDYVGAKVFKEPEFWAGFVLLDAI